MDWKFRDFAAERGSACPVKPGYLNRQWTLQTADDGELVVSVYSDGILQLHLEGYTATFDSSTITGKDVEQRKVHYFNESESVYFKGINPWEKYSRELGELIEKNPTLGEKMVSGLPRDRGIAEKNYSDKIQYRQSVLQRERNSFHAGSIFLTS